MRIQLLSDLHFEQASDLRPEQITPAEGADLLVLAGDIDSRWQALERFAYPQRWPVPVVMVAGNHEFDGRELSEAWPALRQRCEQLGIRLLECEEWLLEDPQHPGRRIRLLGTVRWSDYDLFGAAQRDKAFRAASYYLQRAGILRQGQLFDGPLMRQAALACGDWLLRALDRKPVHAATRWDATVVITHFGPSKLSLDPRYGEQPGSAGFCNADDALVRKADLWLHGHVHHAHDYVLAGTRVVSNPRGHAEKGETARWHPDLIIEV